MSNRTTSTECYDCGGPVEAETMPILHGYFLCGQCEIMADITHCDICGILGFKDDLAFSQNGEGPFCPDCCEAVDEDDDGDDYASKDDEDYDDQCDLDRDPWGGVK